jgi:hypothetical protein
LAVLFPWEFPAASAAQNPSAAGGEVTMRAHRIETPLIVDGHLEDPVYSSVAPTSGFIQQEPHEGALATEQTEVWVLFDTTTLYVSARCLDSRPERVVSTELRRDGGNVSRGDNFVVVLDTFHDRRNGYYFQTNPSGVIRDQSIVAEKSNNEWNTVWTVKTSRFDGGYTVEMAIPFKSLRYAQAGPQVWGINFRRQVKWKNEDSYLTAVPASYGPPGILKMAMNATLLGLQTPEGSRNLEVKPYGVGSISTDRTAAAPFSDKADGDVGFDFKYGLTRGLTADVTINTDFAQIEEDLQQVNLTRFSLFFPEKRDFFLEGNGIFLFGNPPLTRGTLTPGDVPVIFFSRRIGLSGGQSVPVRLGGRVTGKIGNTQIAVMNAQTGEKTEAGAPSTNFTVLRLKQDVMRRSSVGLIATRRAPAGAGGGENVVVGADASLLLYRNVNVYGFFTQARSPGVTTARSSYRAMFEYTPDRFGLIAEHLTVDRNFSPEVGFVQRADFSRTSMLARFSPRPANSERVRKYGFEASGHYITNAERTMVQNRTMRGAFTVDYQNSDVLTVDYQHDYERLPQPFRIANGITLPVASYAYDTARVTYELGQQRILSGRLSAAAGSFYDGTKKAMSYSGRVAPSSRFVVEPGVSLNWVNLPLGAFRVTQITSRQIFTPSPTVQMSALVQYNAGASSISSSVRLHWEYQSGSDLYLVYSEGRDIAVPGFPDMLNRAFAVKLTRLFRF